MGLTRDSYPNKSMEDIWKSEVFTTGMIAKICRVSTRTVSYWFDCGMLKGYRVPTASKKNTNGVRRVIKKDLVKFLCENGMGGLVQNFRGFFGVPKRVQKIIQKTFDAETWASPMDIPLDRLFEEFFVGSSEGLDLAKTVYEWARKRKIKVTYIIDEDGHHPEWVKHEDALLIDEFLKKYADQRS